MPMDGVKHLFGSRIFTSCLFKSSIFGFGYTGDSGAISWNTEHPK